MNTAPLARVERLGERGKAGEKRAEAEAEREGIRETIAMAKGGDDREALEIAFPGSTLDREIDEEAAEIVARNQLEVSGFPQS